jgi:hypothetical protein
MQRAKKSCRNQIEQPDRHPVAEVFHLSICWKSAIPGSEKSASDNTAVIFSDDDCSGART